VAYRLGGAQYSWAPRFCLAVLLLLRDAFGPAVPAKEECRAMEELGYVVVTASVQQCRRALFFLVGSVSEVELIYGVVKILVPTNRLM